MCPKRTRTKETNAVWKFIYLNCRRPPNKNKKKLSDPSQPRGGVWGLKVLVSCFAVWLQRSDYAFADSFGFFSFFWFWAYIGLAKPELAWPGLAMPGLAWPGQAWPGLAMPGQAWPGLAKLGQAWRLNPIGELCENPLVYVWGGNHVK